MKIAVTGAGGFLGRHVAMCLQVRGLAVKQGRHENFDILSLRETRELLRGCDAVVHAAARVGGIGANVASPGQFFFENAQMGQNVIEAARLESLKRVVIVGTACEYPADAPMPLAEESLWQGYPAPETAPYALAKLGLLAMGRAYREQYGLEVEHIIPSNLYGPLDHFDSDSGHVIPGMIVKCSRAQHAREKSVTFWGTGTPTRDFLHVRDAAEGIVAALLRGTDGDPVNLGSGQETPIAEVAKMVAGIYRIPEVLWDSSRPDGARRRLLSTERANALLGWTPRNVLEEGLLETINWYEDWDL